MSILTLLITIGKELLPFLKEALLEGQTFRTWLKSNWLTFAWLLTTLALTMMIAHLSDHVVAARNNERKAEQQWQKLLPPLQTILVDYKRLKTENNQLRLQVEELNATNATYEDWMTTCGVNYQDAGQCKVSSRSAVTPRKPRPKPQQPRRPIPEPEDKPRLIDKLRDLLRNDPEE